MNLGLHKHGPAHPKFFDKAQGKRRSSRAKTRDQIERSRDRLRRLNQFSTSLEHLPRLRSGRAVKPDLTTF